MKIIEGEDEIIKVYRNIWNYGDRESEAIFIEFQVYRHLLTPLEAHQLGTLLIKLVNETDYFKGLKKDD